MNFLFSMIQEHCLILLRQIQSLIFRKPPLKWKKGEKGAVIILPGIFNSWNFFKTIGDFMNALGYQVYMVEELDRNLVTFEEAKDMLETFLEKENLHDIFVVGYSKGGLIAEYFLAYSSLADRIKKLITISTPFTGSFVAYAMTPFNGLEFVPGSTVLKNLKLQYKHNQKIVNIYAKRDNLVIPNTSLYLEHGENIQIPVFGHTNILEAKETFQAIKHILEKN